LWSTFTQQIVENISVFNSFSLCLILLQKISKLVENILDIDFTQYHSFYPELTTIRTENPQVGKAQRQIIFSVVREPEKPYHVGFATKNGNIGLKNTYSWISFS